LAQKIIQTSINTVSSIVFCDIALIAGSGKSHVTISLVGFDETIWLSTCYLSLSQDGIRDWNHFAFMWIVVFTFMQLFSVMLGWHICVREMVFRLTYMVLRKLHG